MLAAAARRRVAVLREPVHAVRIARALWIAWAVIVWNVVFDHVIVVAGRSYILAASLAAATSAPYARMDDWMRPAVSRALWVASASAAAILVAGFSAIRIAAASLQPRQVNPCA
jgi:hypothetical protein